MRAERVLVMIAQRHQQKNADQKNDDDDADCCSGEKLEMKMPLTKKPVGDAAENRPAPCFEAIWYGGVDRRIYHKCYQAAPLPPRPLLCQPTPAEPQSRVSTKFLLNPAPQPRPPTRNPRPSPTPIR